MEKARATFAQMRIIHGVFLITQGLLIFVIFQAHPAERDVAREILYVFPLVAASNIMILGGIRARQIARALDALRNAPEDAAALVLWRAGHILGFVSAESVSLFGLVLKFLGASWNVAGLFFAVGIFLLLLWRPRLDLPSQPG